MSDRRTLTAAAKMFLTRCAETFSLAIGILLVSWSTTALATVYNLDAPPGLAISGTITTDGNLGILSASDITGWQINQAADTTHYPSGMATANSTVSLSGGALTATPTQLLFDFGSIAGSQLTFVSNNIGTNGGFSLQFCDAASPCFNQNNAPLFSSTLLVLVAPGCCATSGGFLQPGKTEIAAAVASVPEPETYALLLTGLGLFGCVARRRKQQAG